MKENKYSESNFFWEVPEIDLHLRHYSGHPSDVIKKLKSDIERYLSNPNLEENRTVLRYDENNNPYMISYNIRQIYSAIYNALNYYKNISYLPSAEYETGESFLSNSVRTFNEDYDYLAQKYNSKDPTQDSVINVCGRIKSPLSFMDKVREKIVEYIEQGRDFRYFNESLRDLIGVRFVINPPKEIQNQGLEAETDYLYHVFYDLMEHHGITKPKDAPLETGLFKFFPVNTRHDPQKLINIKSRPDEEGFAVWVQNGIKGFYRPTKRIPEVEQECVDTVTKDYIRWPKYKGYQSLHVCIIPYYSQDVDHINIPKCIIPPSCKDSFIEYQFRTAKENEYAERGPVSHNTLYKPTGSYHRLAVPFYIEFDNPENLPETAYDPSRTIKKPLNYINRLKLRNFGESFKKYYGPSFEEFFGIPFKKFRDVFGSQDRTDILSKRKTVIYDKESDIYTTEEVVAEKPNPVSLALTPDEVLNLKEILASKDGSRLVEFFSKQHLQDAVIQVIQNPENLTSCSTASQKASGVTLYSLSLSSQRDKSIQKTKKDYKPSMNNPVTVMPDGSSLDDDL